MRHLKISTTLQATCKNCGRTIQSFNNGSTWVHQDLESRCPSPGWAEPKEERK